VQREAALVVDVDQLLGRDRRGGQDTQPGEGVDPLVDPQRPLRDGRPADAVEAVAAGDDVAGEFVALVAVAKAREDTAPGPADA